MPAALFTRLTLPSIANRAIAAAALIALAGCAQQQTGPRESTLTDAQAKAQGREVSRAPTQIQLGFGENAPTPEEQMASAEVKQGKREAQAAKSRPLREAKTFLGTLPCLLGGSCEATRTTLTLAPHGQWRARSEPLVSGGSAAPSAQQGCWEVTGVEPWRIRLRTVNSESSVASFTFVNENVLRVNSVSDHEPMLEYRLTRQADIDGITELDDAEAPVCQ